MKPTALFSSSLLSSRVLLLFLGFLAASSTVLGQPSRLAFNLDSGSSLAAAGSSAADGGTAQVASSVYDKPVGPKPLSRIALGASASSLGIQLQLVTNLNSHFNLRGSGNLFDYSTNFTTSGINCDATVHLASIGAALDFYPFHSGFRISPGVLFHNQNQLTATAVVPAGTSFTLNNQTFYSATTNTSTGATPINGNGTLNLDTNKKAYTITTGWGNVIPRKGGHFSIPFEIGVALIGAPTLNVNLKGWACLDKAQTECSDFTSTTDPVAISAQSALKAQVSTWTNDLKLLRTYPIVSLGVSYNFRIW
jgi:hypothetical protein